MLETTDHLQDIFHLLHDCDWRWRVLEAIQAPRPLPSGADRRHQIYAVELRHIFRHTRELEHQRTNTSAALMDDSAIQDSQRRN